MEDMLITFNQSLKALGDGRIGGYLVVFGDENNTDLEGDYFTKSTDFDVEDGDPITVYYNHGLDPVMKRRKLGRGTLQITDAGVWMEAQLQLRDEYERFIYGQVEAGKMGLSSGSLPNLVEREPRGKAMWVKHWPLGKDGSVTPTPMEWRTTVTTLKSLMAALEADNAPTDESETAMPEALIGAASVTDSEDANARLQLRAQAYLLATDEG